MTDRIAHALQARRLAALETLTANSPAVLDNGHEIDPTETIPPFVALEINMASEIVAFYLCPTLDDAARELDISETDCALRRVHNLDSGRTWEADRRIVGFNLLPTDPDDDPGPLGWARVDILPQRLSSFRPGQPSAKVLVTVAGGTADVAETEGAVQVAILDLDDLTDEIAESGKTLPLTPAAISFLQANEPQIYARLQGNITVEDEPGIAAELDSAERASQELARHLAAMGAASSTHTRYVAGDRYEIFVRRGRPRQPLPAQSETALARTLNDAETNTILHALRCLEDNARLGITDSCERYGQCDHFDEVSRLTTPQIDALCESIRLDSLVLVL